MPLHDWNDLTDWETVHTYWIAELGRWLKPRLPAGYRSSLGTVPALVVAAAPVHPDVSVRRHAEASIPEPPNGPTSPPSAACSELVPDVEAALASLDPARAVFVTRAGNLVAVIELISPRNKDSPETRRSTTDRFLGYLTHGIHPLFVDVHPRPLGFSFADDLAALVQFPAPPCPAPCAVSYRVSGPAPAEGGLYLGAWPRTLTVGAALPTLPLPLTRDVAVLVDLEQTYGRAAGDAYL
jgi:hypothetical protein